MSGRRHTTLALGILAAVCLGTYAGALSAGFVFDDELIVVENPLVKRLGDLPRLFVTDYWAGPFGPGTSHLYRPAVLATFAANHALGGLDPRGYHLVNVMLHAGVGGVLYAVGLALGLSRGAALASGLLFAVHPIHTEAVTGLVGRAELLAALGVLVAWLCHLRSEAAGRLDLRLALAAWAAFALALFSKEHAAAAPLVLLLSDLTARVPASGIQGATMVEGVRFRVRRAWPLHAGHAAVLGIYLAGRAIAVPGGVLTAAPHVAHLDNPIWGEPWSVRLPSALAVAGRYLWLCLWPARLAPDYSFDALPVLRSFAAPAVVAALLPWAGLLALGVVAHRRGHRPIVCGVGLVVIAFLPVSNLVVPIGAMMGERLFYLPSAGLCLVLGGLADAVAARHPRLPRTALVAATGGLVLAVTTLGVRTVVRNRDWRDTETLFARAAVVVPGSLKVAMIHARFLVARGEALAGAIALLERAVRLEPGWPEAHAVLGEAYARTGRWAEAEASDEQALGMARTIYGPAHPRVASLLGQLGGHYVAEATASGRFAATPRSARAEPLLREALAIEQRRPDGEHLEMARILDHLAALYAGQGRVDRAEPLYRQALGIRERLLGAAHVETMASLDRLAQLLDAGGRAAEAEPLYRRAIAILGATLGSDHPRLVEPLMRRAAVLARMGRSGEAQAAAEWARWIRARTAVLDATAPPGADRPDRRSGLRPERGR